MCISFVGAVQAATGGRGRGWMSRAGRRLLLARMSPVALLARVLAMERLVLEKRITSMVWLAGLPSSIHWDCCLFVLIQKRIRLL